MSEVSWKVQATEQFSLFWPGFIMNIVGCSWNNERKLQSVPKLCFSWCQRTVIPIQQSLAHVQCHLLNSDLEPQNLLWHLYPYATPLHMLLHNSCQCNIHFSRNTNVIRGLLDAGHSKILHTVFRVAILEVQPHCKSRRHQQCSQKNWAADELHHHVLSKVQLFRLKISQQNWLMLQMLEQKISAARCEGILVK